MTYQFPKQGDVFLVEDLFQQNRVEDQRLLLPMCEVAPNTQRRTSLDALPPSTGQCLRDR
jgi:hypothetical protein